jgi:hypothetical protein
MPIAPRPSSARQWRAMTGQSRRTCGHANGARIRIAKNHRKNVIAIGGISWCSPRPSTQFTDQKKGVSVSSR